MIQFTIIVEDDDILENPKIVREILDELEDVVNRKGLLLYKSELEAL
jgi:hypothetical protein